MPISGNRVSILVISINLLLVGSLAIRNR